MQDRQDVAMPCPECGYDLRGHPDRTRCPECGHDVQISLLLAEANQWVDHLLLDLWSICVLLSAAVICTLVAGIALREGQYVALILAMAAGLYMPTATLWLAVLMGSLLTRRRRHFLRMVAPTRRRCVARWLFANAGLLALEWFVLSMVWPS